MINLTPGFKANIQIRDNDNNPLFKEDCASTEKVKEFINMYGESKKGWSLLFGSVIVLRTDNLVDFAKDFLLPTFLHYSLRINNLASKIFTSIVAISFDIITLPIRLLTAPFRIYYNYSHPEEKHPILALIENNPESKHALKNNLVKIHYEVENVEMENPTPPDEEGNIFQKAKQSTTSGTILIALKKLPGGTKTKTSEETVDRDYLRFNDEWTVEGSTMVDSSHYNTTF